jgi:hypothetical protein
MEYPAHLVVLISNSWQANSALIVDRFNVFERANANVEWKACVSKFIDPIDNIVGLLGLERCESSAAQHRLGIWTTPIADSHI